MTIACSSTEIFGGLEKNSFGRLLEVLWTWVKERMGGKKTEVVRYTASMDDLIAIFIVKKSTHVCQMT